ncbi:MAG TPA: hypothetical protein VIY52_02720 [Streptosporangiaceae bacterium]
MADHGLLAGCRAGNWYQAIRSAPGRSRFGASAISRSVTFSSLAASRSSVAASHWRRAPFHTARHRPPSPRAGYTVTPHSSSNTTRSSPRLAALASPCSRAPGHAPRSRAATSEADAPPGPGAGRLWGFVGILD